MAQAKQTHGNTSVYRDVTCGVSPQVTIRVRDVNDNAPEFTTPPRVTVPEDAAPGAPVFTFRATDADTGLNAQVSHVASPLLWEPSVFGNAGCLDLDSPLRKDNPYFTCYELLGSNPRSRVRLTGVVCTWVFTRFLRTTSQLV